MKSFICSVFMLLALVVSVSAASIPQFTDSTLSGWTLKSNIPIGIPPFDVGFGPAHPADPPRFSFPMMPSGKVGLNAHGGKFWYSVVGLTPSAPYNDENYYILSKTFVVTKPGDLSFRAQCSINNFQFMAVRGALPKANKFVIYGTGKAWKSYSVPLEPGTWTITMDIQTGQDVQFDEFVLPE